MKRRTWIIYGLLFVTIAGVIIKLTIPLSFKEIPIRTEALHYAEKRQVGGAATPSEVAVSYHYFNTDYQNAKYPDWVEVHETHINENAVRVTIYDPRCQDDSVHCSMVRYYLQRSADGLWRPTKAEFAQKGRGRFGWTTEPTS